MTRIRRSAIVLLLVAATGASELRVPLWVADQAELKAEQIEAWINGDRVAVEGLQSPSEPLILMLVMDTVGDLSRIDAARSAIARYVESMDPQWRVALLQAQDGLRVVEDPTSDHEKLLASLSAVPVSGTPGLLDAVAPAASIAQSVLSQSDVRVAVLFVTDGSITQYRGDYSAAVVNPSDRGDLSRRFRDRVVQERVTSLMASLRAYSAPLFCVHLQERNGDLDVAYQNGIQRFAEETAGEAYFVRAISDVESAIDQALERIDSHYSVRLKAPSSEGTPLDIRLESPEAPQLEYRQSLEHSETSQ
jgi:Mg-chelatase subunit ChlD